MPPWILSTGVFIWFFSDGSTHITQWFKRGNHGLELWPRSTMRKSKLSRAWFKCCPHFFLDNIQSPPSKTMRMYFCQEGFSSKEIPEGSLPREGRWSHEEDYTRLLDGCQQGQGITEARHHFQCCDIHTLPQKHRCNHWVGWFKGDPRQVSCHKVELGSVIGKVHFCAPELVDWFYTRCIPVVRYKPYFLSGL